MSRRHLLYFAFWFPPSRASGVYRARATVEAFIARGWKVTVVTCDERFLRNEIGSTDPTLLEDLSPEVDIVRVPFTLRGNPVDVRSMSRLEAMYPAVWRAVRRRLQIPGNWLKAGRSTSIVGRLAEPYAAWIEPAADAGLEVHRQTAVDAIIATGNPFSSFEAARRLATSIDRPFLVDYRDPWTIDVFTGEHLSLGRTVDGVERSVVESAAGCVHVNQAIAEAYAAKYPAQAEQQQVVWNGYDIDSIGPVPPEWTSGPLVFGMLGTLNSRWPMDAIAAGWASAREHLPPGSELRLGGHLGYFAQSETALASKLPSESDGFRYVGPVTKRGVADFYAGLDVVVVPAPGGAMVTSGKVFEASALGVPVLCVQAAGGGARAVLANHELAVCSEPTATEVSAGFVRAAELAMSRSIGQSAAVRAAAERFERMRAIDGLVDLTEQAVAATLVTGP